jgi:L-alanine-DL-glutamate epimerase-like enolase superfamily enzyme
MRVEIRSVTLYSASLPLAEPFEHASSGRIDTLHEVVLRLVSTDGVVGWSEMRANNHYVTGDTPDRVAGVLCQVMLPRLVAQDVGSPRAVADRMARAVVGNPTAKALVDIAVHDLVARTHGIPVHVLLGGRRHDTLHCHATLPFCDAEEAARRACVYLDAGFTTIKLRLGLRPFARDLERVAVVRAAMAGRPGALRLAADVNQGWQAKETIRNLRALAPYDLAWIEQPVPADDFAGLRDVRRAVDIPVIADESCASPADLLRLLREEAVDGFHFKLCKAGGIGRLMGMIAVAEAAGRPYMIGQMDEGMLATAAAVQCGLTADALSFELWGYQRVAAEPFQGLELRGSAMHPGTAPGLGIAVDIAGLTELAHFEG